MLKTSLPGQMILSGIQETALGTWQRLASVSFAPCLACGHQPASATTTSEREIEIDGKATASCSTVLFVRVSLVPAEQTGGHIGKTTRKGD